MKANAILADRLDEAFEPPQINHQATANEVGAGINGEIVREEEVPFIQDVRTTGLGKAQPQKLTSNLSPFSEDGSIHHSKTIKLFTMKTTFFIIASAIFGAMANPAPSAMGIEVIQRDGLTMVREVVSFSDIC